MAATQKLASDDHRHGMTAHSPLMLLTGFIASGIAFYVFTQLQITATETAVLGLLQSDVTAPLNMTAHQLIDFMFQSSPDPQAGCNNVTYPALPLLIDEFQSSPDPQAGCNPHICTSVA